MRIHTTTYKWALTALLMLWGCAVSVALANAKANAYVITGNASAPTYNFRPTSTYFESANSAAPYSQAIRLASQSAKQTHYAAPVFTVKLSNTSNHSVEFASTGGGSYSGGSSSSGTRGISYSGGTFRTTSIMIPSTGATSVPSLSTTTALASRNKLRQSNPWDEDPTDDPIGVVPTVPVGSPLVLLLMAFVYVLYKRRKLALQTSND